jgi:plastocyanin
MTGRTPDVRSRTLPRWAATFGAATFGAAVLAAAVLVGCGGGSGLGLDQPPASLDPASPRLTAEGLAFDTAELAVPADAPFVLVFENREAVSHNVSIYADDARRDRRFEGVIFGGPGTRWYPVAALPPGTYVFVCDLHPSMTGRLVAR